MSNSKRHMQFFFVCGFISLYGYFFKNMTAANKMTAVLKRRIITKNKEKKPDFMFQLCFLCRELIKLDEQPASVRL